MTLRVVLIGGSGFLGRGLREQLVGLGHEVIVIGRGPGVTHADWRAEQWDAQSLGSWTNALEGADAVVHLAGKRVDARPTKSNIAELISSREGTVRLVGQAVQGLDNPPNAWVQLSSLAVFGSSQDDVITERTVPPATGLPQQVEVTQRWEAAYEEATVGVERAVLLRPGVAIGGSDDPATFQLARLARCGLGGSVGTGDQWVSWISASDLFDLLVRSVIDQRVSGLYHLTSPNPVRNSELMAAYRKAVGRKIGLPSSRLITTIGAWLLGSDPALALTGRRCIPARLIEEGYEFNVTDIDQAVAAAVGAIGE